MKMNLDNPNVQDPHDTDYQQAYANVPQYPPPMGRRSPEAGPSHYRSAPSPEGPSTHRPRHAHRHHRSRHHYNEESVPPHARPLNHGGSGGAASRMPAPPPQYFNAPLRTTYNMPVRGSKEAPKTFKGKYSEVQQFVDHYEKLLNKNDEAQYTVKELNAAAEWYFRRNRYESIMVHAADLGEEQVDDYSGDELILGSSSSDEGEEDYNEYLRRKKQRAKKKKQEKKEKLTSMKPAGEQERQRFNGTEEEIANMIRKLNAMRIDDPEYAPVYFKVMVMDKTGTAEKCVKPPALYQSEPPPPLRTRPPYRPPAPENKPPASYPNNIPLGTAPNERGGGSECYGCLENGHRIFEGPAVAELIGKDVMKYNEETRRLCMKNGDAIRRYSGESLVKAAERQAGQAPRVMFALTETKQERAAAVHSFYQQEGRRAQIVEIYSTEASSEEGDGNKSDEEVPETSDSPGSSSDERVYLSVPKSQGYRIFEAQRTVPSIRKIRKETFDGVSVPARGNIRKGEVRDLRASPSAKDKGKGKERDRVEPSAVPEPAPPPDRRTTPPKERKTSLPTRGLENIQPFEARKVRYDKDAEMRDVEGKKRPLEESPDKGETRDEGGKKAGRQSELSATVDRRQVLNRIMDATVPMSIREIMVTSKDLCVDFQDLIKLKNVRAVLLGSTRDHPLIANLNIPRTDDTGSQLDVVSAEVTALKIQRTVDMSQVTGMHDANGGNSQLQGWIRDVEFNCGGAYTVTDLWVSRKPPFDLLLGRPWQCGNLVSIDEREEGTYLIFKDRITRRPRYELLASFAVMRDESGRRTQGSSEGTGDSAHESVLLARRARRVDDR
ncbi:hypothetical protein C8F04DRAFT_1265125 [Mycena alexandri]|uniref:DUF4100 domain-containing protein n=1 Tax=Mycena alexandri TaxID=1745969 RepID=A0AAD6SKU2_9AGAR|nr:hypothetical protein C8F04DRAFT_1265125 [Mycena alexandri]